MSAAWITVYVLSVFTAYLFGVATVRMWNRREYRVAFSELVNDLKNDEQRVRDNTPGLHVRAKREQ